jgi:small GTP-binding protein
MQPLFPDFHRHKVAILGPFGTGKTALLTRYATDAFTDEYQPTVGAGFVSRDVKTSSGLVVLDIWDTAGQERFRSLVPRYSHGASALILVFDLSNQATFDEARALLDSGRTDYDVSALWYLVGNKSDIDMACDRNEITTWAKEHGIPFFVTSAKTGENLTELFLTVAQDVSAIVPPLTQIPERLTRWQCC